MQKKGLNTELQMWKVQIRIKIVIVIVWMIFFIINITDIAREFSFFYDKMS